MIPTVLRWIFRAAVGLGYCVAPLSMAQQGVVASTPLPACADVPPKDQEPAQLPSQMALNKKTTIEWQEYLANPFPLPAKEPKTATAALADAKRKQLLEALRKPQTGLTAGGGGTGGMGLGSPSHNFGGRSSGVDGAFSSLGGASSRGVGSHASLEQDLLDTPVTPRSLRLAPLLRYSPQTGTNAVIRARDPSREMVLGGTPVPGGSVGIDNSRLGASKLAAVDVKSGMQCWRPAELGDITTPYPNKGTTKLMVDPYGFREVGVMVKRDKAEGTSKRVGICSFVLIHPRYALTATHCLWTWDASSKKITSVVDQSEKILWLYPKVKSSAQKAVDCLEDTQPCQFERLSVKEKYHAENLRWVADNETWEQDIALIEFETPITDTTLKFPVLPASSTPLNTVLPEKAQITVAGYGGNTENLSSADTSYGNFSAGVQTLLAQYANELTWIKESSSAITGVCFGDSGGPLYQGWFVGQEKETHVLVGIHSRLYRGDLQGEIPILDHTHLGEKVPRCLHEHMQSRSQIVLKDLAWICTKTGNALKSCTK